MSVAKLTRRQIEDALVAWVQAVLVGGSVVVGWTNAPRPAPLPYVTVRIINIAPIGFDDIGAVDLGTGLQTIYGDRLVTVSVQAFSQMQSSTYSGTSALDMIRTLANSVWKQSVRAALISAGLAPQLAGPINDLTQLLETEAEERAHIDMNFGVKDLESDDVGVIEHVVGDGSIRTDTGHAIVISFAGDLA